MIVEARVLGEVMSEGTLFGLPPEERRDPAPPTRPEEARVLRPVREQLQWVARDLEGAVAPEHPARAIWGLLEKMDLSAFYGSIKAVVERPGRPTTDPQVLLALWLLATVEGVGSAPGVWPGCAGNTTPTAGCVAECPPTIACSRTFEWPTNGPWTVC